MAETQSNLAKESSINTNFLCYPPTEASQILYVFLENSTTTTNKKNPSSIEQNYLKVN